MQNSNDYSISDIHIYIIFIEMHIKVLMIKE